MNALEAYLIDDFGLLLADSHHAQKGDENRLSPGWTGAAPAIIEMDVFSSAAWYPSWIFMPA
ncbi:MAG: hypothetical protein GF344_19850 [Chitinivibrionales bacterium]|nr:hypothetical protein [Chitinivibrionales bacterium]MBD3358867.1 hypothetical protein [Chitinivibrionales bacterium]